MTFTLALVAATGSYVYAHGGEHNKLMGTIDSVSEAEMVVVDAQRESHVVRLRPATRYLSGSGEVSSRTDLGKGTRVVVTFASDGSGAAEIRFGSASANRDNDSDSHGDAHEHGHEGHHGHGHDD